MTGYPDCNSKRHPHDHFREVKIFWTEATQALLGSPKASEPHTLVITSQGSNAVCMYGFVRCVSRVSNAGSGLIAGHPW